jgi:diguanylate cyclase (GGDEF)-like protein
MEETSTRSGPPLVLVVSASEDFRARARAALGSEGFSVSEAADLGEARRAMANVRAELLFVEYAMLESEDFAPLCDPWGREDERVPMLVTIASDAPETVERATRAGADDFVLEPVPWGLLAHRARLLLQSHRTDTDLRFREKTLQGVQRIARLGSWEWNVDTDQMRWSDEIYRIFGMKPQEVPANLQNLLSLVHPGDREAMQRHFEESGLVDEVDTEHRISLPTNEVRYVQLRAEWTLEERDGGTWVHGTLQDVTDERKVQAKIRYLANYDSLTGLANRHRFRDRLEQAVEEARAKDEFLALLYMDLDQFKRINDTLGHSAGDRLLQSVADLLRRQVRRHDLVGRGPDAEVEADPEISRLGGDEFTVLLAPIATPEKAGDVARRILRALPRRIRIDDNEIATTGSIGIAVFPLDGQDAETLVKHADRAMYYAKESGRNNYQFFDESMNISSMRKMHLESHLRTALESDQLQIIYQPRVDLRTGWVCGMEALARWQHPELGVISPKEFIPVAEETGLIVSIGQWILENACVQNRAWQRQGYERLKVSVNVSSRQFAQHDLHEVIARALHNSGLDPRDLELEITESTMLQDSEETIVALRDLKAMGVRIALDDFGTGYSSLSYLTRFSLDTLKLDRSIVQGVDVDPASAGITTAVIAMARSLGLRVVAEGVDTDEQAHFLRERGCDEIQGFLFSGPVTPSEFVRYLVKDGRQRRRLLLDSR